MEGNGRECTMEGRKEMTEMMMEGWKEMKEMMKQGRGEDVGWKQGNERNYERWNGKECTME